jgi:hypothetical protein
MPRPCTGDCDDRRLELVPAADLARLDAASRRAQALEAVARQLSAADPAPEEWEPAFRALRASARDALASEPAAGDAPFERVTAWWCATCGRIEAPRSCVGICVRRPEEMVRAALYDEAAAHAPASLHAEATLAGVVQTVAHVTPRPGQWERTGGALRARARVIVDSLGKAAPT